MNELYKLSSTSHLQDVIVIKLQAHEAKESYPLPPGQQHTNKDSGQDGFWKNKKGDSC